MLLYQTQLDELDPRLSGDDGLFAGRYRYEPLCFSRPDLIHPQQGQPFRGQKEIEQDLAVEAADSGYPG